MQYIALGEQKPTPETLMNILSIIIPDTFNFKKTAPLFKNNMSGVSAKILLKHGISVPLPLLSPSPITYITYSAILEAADVSE